MSCCVTSNWRYDTVKIFQPFCNGNLSVTEYPPICVENFRCWLQPVVNIAGSRFLQGSCQHASKPNVKFTSIMLTDPKSMAKDLKSSHNTNIHVRWQPWHFFLFWVSNGRGAAEQSCGLLAGRGWVQGIKCWRFVVVVGIGVGVGFGFWFGFRFGFV